MRKELPIWVTALVTAIAAVGILALAREANVFQPLGLENQAICLLTIGALGGSVMVGAGILFFLSRR